MKLTASTEIGRPADEVWDVIGQFDGITRWAPGIVECRLEGYDVGAVRHIKFKNGMEVSERLETFDPENRTFSYSIVKGPLPVENYLSTVAVEDKGDRCTLHWETQGDPKGVPEEQLEPILSGVCHGGSKALKSHCEMQGTKTMKKYVPEE